MNIYTFGGGDYLSYLFTALSTMMASGMFAKMASIAGLLGILWVMLQALSMKGPPDLGYIVRWALLYLALVGPGTTINIVDNLLVMTRPQIITGIPLGIAAVASVSSSLGSGLAKAYDTALLLPQDYQYTQNGLNFGHSMLSSLSNYDLSAADPALSADMSTFGVECVFPAIARGQLIATTVETSSNLNAVILAPGSYSQNRFVILHDPALGALSSVSTGTTFTAVGGDYTLSCSDAAAALQTLLTNDNNAIVQSLASRLFPNGAPASYGGSAAAIIATSGSALNDFVGVAYGAGQALQQAALMGAMRNALDTGTSSPKPSGMATALASAKAEREQMLTYQTMGNMAQRLIPEVHIVLEAILYAAFPVILLIALLPNGIMALGTYVGALVWVQTWPLLFSVVNSIHYFYSVIYLPATATGITGAPTFSLSTSGGIGDFASQMSVLAGYMSLSVPMIAYMIVNGGAQIGASVASHLTGPAQSAAAAASSQVAAGNIQSDTLTMGNRSINNSTANQSRTSSSVDSGTSSYTGSSGITLTASSGGNTSISGSRVASSGVNVHADTSAGVSSVVSQGISQSATATATARQDQAAAQVQTMAAANSYVQSQQSGSGSGISTSTGSSSTVQSSYATMQSVASTIGGQLGWSNKKAESALARAALGVSVAGTGGGVTISAEEARAFESAVRSGTNAELAQKFGTALTTGHSAAQQLTAQATSGTNTSGSEGLTSAASSEARASAGVSAAQSVEAAWRSQQGKEGSIASRISANADGYFMKAAIAAGVDPQNNAQYSAFVAQQMASPQFQQMVQSAIGGILGGSGLPAANLSGGAPANNVGVQMGASGATVTGGPSGGSASVGAPAAPSSLSYSASMPTATPYSRSGLPMVSSSGAPSTASVIAGYGSLSGSLGGQVTAGESTVATAAAGPAQEFAAANNEGASRSTGPMDNGGIPRVVGKVTGLDVVVAEVADLVSKPPPSAPPRKTAGK